MESKAQIRKNLIKSLENFPSFDKAMQTKAVTQAFTASPSWRKSKKIALYMATPLEFDLSGIFEQAKTDGKQILIPKCLPHRQMIFSAYLPDDLKKSNFGLLEPAHPVAEVPDLILVPGLAWNRDGYRIGFGGGYYDRYLANFQGLTASVAYDFQFVDFLPEKHDIMIQEPLIYGHL